MPLIVYLHGINGKGDDLSDLLVLEDFAGWLADGTLGEVPAYVLIPQLPSDQKDWLAAKETVMSAIREVMATAHIDRGNVSLTGFSMGGAGVWGIAASYPEMFQRIAPCAGGMRTTEAALSALSSMEIWAFVGMEDTVVNPQPTIELVERLARNNSRAVLTKLDGAAHTDVPALVYLSDKIDLIPWLIGK